MKKVKRLNMFLRVITLNRIIGITLAPFGIYLNQEYFRNERVINHESIHWKQQIEMLILPFYLWYFIEWIIRLFTNTGNAYKAISFEREAKQNETNFEYLKERKFWNWVKYLKKN